MSSDNPITPALIVFSDLDGTLLDHDTYDWSAAIPALERMKTLGVPLVLASSKTAFELYELRAAMGFADAPAIVENGAGLLPADGKPREDAKVYNALLSALADVPSALRKHFRGFSEWTTSQVARETGLSQAEAALAAKRQFSEPGHWIGSEDQLSDFLAALAERGIVARRGGRFLTLSFGATKADRVAEITRSYDLKPVTMALGDAPNDVEMIAVADFGVIVANPHGAPLPAMAGEATGQITRTTDAGPVGWNKSVLARMEQIYGVKR
ncbi:HAD-IIB family hydrolase [Celeribacter sp.]|uniref:HAD-IIB family hydrolase n=1 Tax=Celeribacter sp. TaxID=1890673 RepID=UPI003A9224ED